MSLAASYARILRTAFGDEDRDPRTSHDDVVVDVARGDTRLDEGESQLASPLDGVDDGPWTQFVRGLTVASPGDVSPSNGVGMFCMMPRRLDDLGLVRRLSRSKADGKMVWVAEFLPPLTSELFLTIPEIQYAVFRASIGDYDGQMARGEIEREPELSRSGSLAVLHRCGPQGLKTWASGDRFPATQAVVDRVSGIF